MLNLEVEVQRLKAQIQTQTPVQINFGKIEAEASKPQSTTVEPSETGSNQQRGDDLNERLNSLIEGNKNIYAHLARAEDYIRKSRKIENFTAKLEAEIQRFKMKVEA